MLPNRFPDNPQEVLPESEYNTVDATLWYFDAVEKYLKATKDWELGQELYPALADIMRWHIQGTRFNIKVDERDGLLASGAEGVQLTWMDAKVGDWVVTPRRGKPIEINALWYHACRVMTELARRFGTAEKAKEYANLAYKIAANFEEIYWYEAGGYFYDLVNEFGQPDPALRPNQIIALAIAPELFSTRQAEAALAQVRQHLLIPFGLRTLSPQDLTYRPTYGGDQFHRDSAYHQGTVWPWLLGPFGQVVLRLEGREALSEVLSPFVRQLDEAAVGQLNEVFGAEPPFSPAGCIAQAWSVAQLLETWQLYKNGS
jgi:predicted glycogen debranching enzyme